MKRIFLITLPIFFVLAVSCFLHRYLIDYNETLSMLASFFWACFVFLALGRMFFIGSFKYTAWCRIGYFGFATLIIGMLFTLQHWPNGRILIVTGCSIIGIVYFIHFIKKQAKRVLDWGKVLYVITLMITITFRMLHYEFNEELSWVLFVTGIILIVTFYFHELKSPEKEGVELDHEGENVFKYDE
jgi:hypothetical protein